MRVICKIALLLCQLERIGNGERTRTYYFTLPVVLALSRLVSVVFVSTICYTNFGGLCFFASTHIRWAVECDGGVISVEETFCLRNPCELSKRKLAGLSYNHSVSEGNIPTFEY